MTGLFRVAKRGPSTRFEIVPQDGSVGIACTAGGGRCVPIVRSEGRPRRPVVAPIQSPQVFILALSQGPQRSPAGEELQDEVKDDEEDAQRGGRLDTAVARQGDNVRQDGEGQERDELTQTLRRGRVEGDEPKEKEGDIVRRRRAHQGSDQERQELRERPSALLAPRLTPPFTLTVWA